jgi:2-phosphosulfolactate phosphatase
VRVTVTRPAVPAYDPTDERRSSLVTPEVDIALGPGSIPAAAALGRAVVVVDVLRFSSTVVTALSNGFTIYPCTSADEAKRIERETGAEISGKTGEGRYTLSPLDYVNPKLPGEVILISPNGARCATSAAGDATVLVGCFLNARAVARALEELFPSTTGIVLVAAGEVAEDREYDAGSRRFAIEDYLGCGAILSTTHLPLSPDAELCKRSFDYSVRDYADLIQRSRSGKWLTARGLEADIVHCVQRDLYGLVPLVRDGSIAPTPRRGA